MLHSGTVDGWVSGAELRSVSCKSSSGNYDHEMNLPHLMEWWNIQLLTSILPNSLTVVDNASYHNEVVEKIHTKMITCSRLCV